MTQWAIADTGPLVAYFDRRERHHGWAVAQFERLAAPLLVCEPVLTETLFLLSRQPAAGDALLNLVEQGILTLGFRLDEHVGAVRALRRKYVDLPMSLADACVVRMSEIHPRRLVLTLDSDFNVYRRNGTEPLSLLSPEVS